MDLNIQVDRDRENLFSYLDEYVERAHSKNLHLGIAVLEVINYRNITSQFGYISANKFLDEIRNNIEKMVHSSECVIKISCNTFIILLPKLLNKNHAVMASNKLQRILLEEIQINNNQVIPKCHVGISLYPGDGITPEILFRNAEAALVIAIQQNTPQKIYSKDEEDSLTENRRLEIDLIEAIENNGFEVYYQPKIQLKDMSLNGAEALIRWIHPTLGFISPEVFIKQAEQLGIITRITEFVLKTVFQDFATLQSLGLSKVSINLSTLDLRNYEINDTIRNAMSIWGIDGESIIFEVTESTVMEEELKCVEHLNQLVDMGASISIDDFGTGYSSLQYFKNIPATELKIDRCFVSNMLTDNSDANIIELVISLARFFKMQVVAEGVEDKETLNKLAELGCDIIQGYYFSKPLCLEDFKVWSINFNDK